jgi:magnesium transporter
MLRLFKPLTKKVGQSPGTLHHVGVKKADKTALSLIRYNHDIIDETVLNPPFDFTPPKEFQGVDWMVLTGLQDITTLEALGKSLSLHPLVKEDILNTLHRPKLEEFDDYIFVVLKLLKFNREEQEVEVEQISAVLTGIGVASFHERKGGVLDTMFDRLFKGKGRIRKMGPDYLFYALMDAVVDHYFLALESMGEEIDKLEDRLLENPEKNIQQDLHFMKQELSIIRRMVLPLRGIMSDLLRTDSPLISESCQVFLRDLSDHIAQVIETADIYRETLNGLRDLYLSQISSHMNEVMKVLTIIATIFIPLTFIAGIYGMNFDWMPELKWKLGYFIIWGVMLSVTTTMIIYFKRKKWL